MANKQVSEFKDVAPKSQKPDFKLSEMANKTVVITAYEKREGEYQGEKTVFYSATMQDGKRCSINEGIYNQLDSIEKDAFPVRATFTQKTNKRGQKYFILA